MKINLQGVAYSLALLPWDLFATLTFPNPLPKESARWSLAWRHLQRQSDTLGVPYSSLLIALRYERGELTDRPHFHYLLGRTGSRNIITTCKQTAWDWHQATGGHDEARPYTPGAVNLHGYVDKVLGGNLYELKKFRRAGELVLSSSVLKLIGRMRSQSEDEPCEAIYGNSGSLGPVQDGAAQSCLSGVSGLVAVRPCVDKLVSSHVGCIQSKDAVAWVKTSGGEYQRSENATGASR